MHLTQIPAQGSASITVNGFFIFEISFYNTIRKGLFSRLWNNENLGFI